MLRETLKRIYYFVIETGAESKTLSDTHYGSNYNEIFKNDGPELDRQTLPINKLDNLLNSKSLNETDYKNGINDLFKDDRLFNDTSSQQSNHISSMVDFDILRSSFSSFQNGRDHFFLTNIVN